MRIFFLLVLASGFSYVAHAQVVTPRDLLEVSDFSSPVVSPDGKLVAFRVQRASIERNTYDTFWYVQDVDGTSPPRRIAGGGVVLRGTAGIPLPAKVLWSPDDRWIYYRASVDGRIDVWRAAVDGSGAVPLTHDSADVRSFRLTDKGRTLQYSVGTTREKVRAAEWAEYYKGIHVDASVPVGQPLFRSGNIGGRLATQRYGKIWFNRVPLLADAPDHWKAMDLKTMKTRNVDEGAIDDADRKRYPDAWIVSRSPKGDRVAILTRIGKRNGLRDKPNVRLSAALLGKGRQERVVCKAAACTGKTITAIQWRPRSEEVLFTVTDPARGFVQSIYRWNVKSGVVIPVVHSNGLLNGGRDRSRKCGVSFAAMVCVSATASQPPRLERVDLETGARKVLFDPNAALAKEMTGVSVSLLRWKDAKDRLFTGQFYAAKSHSGTTPPLFVDYYRCAGFVRGGVGDEWPFAVLAAHGISALCINAAPYLVNPVDRYGEGLEAVKSAVRLLSARSKIDASRVGMGGLSFGSEVTMWVAMKSRLLAAASVSSASASPNYYLFGSLKGKAFTGTLKKLWGLGAPGDTPKRWHVLSPVFNLDKISAPILFQMPEQEYMQATDYVIPMIRENMADLYVFPNEPHLKFQPKHKLAIYRRNVDWFRFWLQGYEDADPSKTSQYVRWRAMRKRVKSVRSSAPLTCKKLTIC